MSLLATGMQRLGKLQHNQLTFVSKRDQPADLSAANFRKMKHIKDIPERTCSSLGKFEALFKAARAELTLRLFLRNAIIAGKKLTATFTHFSNSQVGGTWCRKRQDSSVLVSRTLAFIVADS